MTVSEPNLILRDVRKTMRMSQEDLARAIRQDGQRTGQVNNCTKRVVQPGRWSTSPACQSATWDSPTSSTEPTGTRR